MKYTRGKIIYEKGEPYIRSCWKCNTAHDCLKGVNLLHGCFECGRLWIYGKFCNSEKQLIEIMKKEGLKSGVSSAIIDKGYRVCHITFRKSKKLKGDEINDVSRRDK